MISRIIFSIVLAFCLTFVTGGIVEDVRDCGSVGTVLKIEVTNCTRQPCVLIKERAYEAVIDFIPANPSNLLNLEITASITIIDIPIVTPGGGNGCEGLSSGCPMSGGVFQRHSKFITITGDFFDRDAIVTFKLTDDAGTEQVCIRADVLVQPEQSRQY